VGTFFLGLKLEISATVLAVLERGKNSAEKVRTGFMNKNLTKD
jgi:hypothetical protein